MKTYIKKTHEAIIEYLEGLNNSELMQVHNEYCENMQYDEDRVYENSEDFLEENFATKLDAVRAATYGEYDFRHDYAIVNGNGNIETSNDVSDFVDIPSIASDILENPENYYGIELEEEEEEEEN
jgi:hypothetical protein